MQVNILAFAPALLCRVEEFADNVAGSILRYTPIHADGEPDPSREVYFIGKTYLGPQELRFTMAVKTLPEAMEQFANCIMAVLKEAQDNSLRQKLLGQDGRPATGMKPS